MYVFSNSCRICGNDIPEDRKQSGLNVCTCGWVEPNQHVSRWEKDASKRISTFGIAAVGVLLPIVLFFAAWSGFGLDVLALGTKSLLGMSTPADILQKAEICEQVRKLDCATANYGRLIRMAPQEEDAYLRLAHLYIKANDKNAAIQVYQAFFMSGGKDANLKFRMANLMADAGQTEMAAKTYQELLDSEPGILQITVAKAYVQLLIKVGQFQDAKAVITTFQSKGDNAKDYLTEELVQIEAQLKGKKI